MIPLLVTDIDWNMWAAIGQIASAVVALGIVLIPYISHLWNRPKVVVSHRIIKESTFHQVNLHIWNHGNTTALNVNVTVDSILQNDQPIQVTSFPYRIGGTFNLQSEEHQSIPLLRIGDQLSNMELGQEDWFINRHDSLFNILVTGDNITAIRETFTYTDSSSLPQVRFEKH